MTLYFSGSQIHRPLSSWVGGRSNKEGKSIVWLHFEWLRFYWRSHPFSKFKKHTKNTDPKQLPPRKNKHQTTSFHPPKAPTCALTNTTKTHERPGAKMREVPLPGLRRRTSPPSAAIRSASAKSSGLTTECRPTTRGVGPEARKTNDDPVEGVVTRGCFSGWRGWGSGLWFANGWMPWDGCWFLLFGMLANKKCWETRTNGERGKRKKHRQSQ